MKRFVALHFLPGSAGNFFARCINLLDNTYCFSDREQLPQTLEEKLKIFSYDRGETTAHKTNSWVVFESKIHPYYNFREHWNIDKDGVAVITMHPASVELIKTFSGIDDMPINVYIDPVEHLDWCILNGFNKTSFQTISWFQAAEMLENDKSVYKVNLGEIINGDERFLIEFTKLANFLDRTVNDNIATALKLLYNQWYPTTLQGQDLENYRTDAVKIFKKILNCIDK